jgi:hypothetical protein
MPLAPPVTTALRPAETMRSLPPVSNSTGRETAIELLLADYIETFPRRQAICCRRPGCGVGAAYCAVWGAFPAKMNAGNAADRL